MAALRLIAVLAVLALAGCSTAPAATPAPVTTSAPATTTTPAASATPAPVRRGPTPDELAGLLGRDVAPSLGGAFDVVAGSAAAPGAGPVRTVRVEVERGLPVDGTQFASFVMATLNDPRSWGAGGRMSFARTGGVAQIVVVLASPATSRRMCRPLETYGKLSCRSGDRAVLTFHRWVLGHSDYADNPTGYRQYVVNHEVGHVLGHGHEQCPGAGRPAPVMQQQTLGLRGCAQNPWPFP